MGENPNDKRVVVTLTTIPTRLAFEGEQGIKLCIDSLVNQSYENYEIHFNIPLMNITTEEEYIIPEWLTAYEKIQIFRTEDLGPATKLVPTVRRITEPETIIIVADDDLVYHADMVKEQVINQEKWPEAAVGYDGMRSRDHLFNDIRDYYFTSNYKSSRVDILQHYKSISYKRRYFEDDFFDFVTEYFSWSDDMLMSAYFSYKKRDRIATFHPSDTEYQSLEEWSVNGGVTTFPVLRHTHHEYAEGCNVFKIKNITDNGINLYKFIDNGYEL